jgi:predicted transcriptional regulator YheO
MTPRGSSERPPGREHVSFTAAERAHAARVVELLSPIIEALAQAWQPRTEVVLHDLTKMPNTIAAIAGSITGRGVGGPPTDLGLRVFSCGWNEHLIGYRTRTAEGLPMRSSSIFFRASSGAAVACLCLNTDVSELERASTMIAALAAGAGIEAVTAGQQVSGEAETFAISVEMLTEGILRDAISATGVPTELMKKAHKLEVVRELDRRGFFTIREAVDLAAHSLGVSRFTIYNYLNELQADATDAGHLPGAVT